VFSSLRVCRDKDTKITEGHEEMNAEIAARLGPDGERILREAAEAFSTKDAARLRTAFETYPVLKGVVNEPIAPFDSPAIVHASSREMLDVLLDAGADIDARSRWWAGGFGVLDHASPDVAAYAIERGATVTVHAAARLGLIDQLREMLTRDPALVHARGGDGQTPLHVAATVEVATLLLEHGADIDALDVDHESTPAQYLIRDRPDVVAFLIARGCRTDLLMAAAVGDLDLARRHLDRDPGLIRIRVSEQWFPKTNPRSGGTIYQWTLGFYASAHQVAKALGHNALLDLLFERSPAPLRLLEACALGDDQAARRFFDEAPDALRGMSEDDRTRVADAARNNDVKAVTLMLRHGWPVDARGQHRATPLHWAAFHGNAEMVREVLRYNPPLEIRDGDFNGTPLGWAIHGSENGWFVKTGDYGATVDLLLGAGATPPETVTQGSAAVRAALARK
jgi:ankyrin repeat protein